MVKIPAILIVLTRVPTSAFDAKQGVKHAGTVNLRLAAAEAKAVCRTSMKNFADHIRIPLCPLGQITRKL